MTQYTIEIDGYESALTESAVKDLARISFPRAESIEVVARDEAE